MIRVRQAKDLMPAATREPPKRNPNFLLVASLQHVGPEQLGTSDSLLKLLNFAEATKGTWTNPGLMDISIGDDLLKWLARNLRPLSYISRAAPLTDIARLDIGLMNVSLRLIEKIWNHLSDDSLRTSKLSVVLRNLASVASLIPAEHKLVRILKKAAALYVACFVKYSGKPAHAVRYTGKALAWITEGNRMPDEDGCCGQQMAWDFEVDDLELYAAVPRIISALPARAAAPTNDLALYETIKGAMAEPNPASDIFILSVSQKAMKIMAGHLLDLAREPDHSTVSDLVYQKVDAALSVLSDYHSAFCIKNLLESDLLDALRELAFVELRLDSCGQHLRDGIGIRIIALFPLWHPAFGARTMLFDPLDNLTTGKKATMTYDVYLRHCTTARPPAASQSHAKRTK